VDQTGRQIREPIQTAARQATVDRNILAIDVAAFVETPEERLSCKCSSELGAMEDKKPTTGIADCCARAVSGYAAAARLSSVMNSRHFSG
jgi:hypothetical protein